MTRLLLVIVAVATTQVLGSYFDVFEQGLEHEPRVAIHCGHVPFHIDLKSGKWISDKESLAQCDTNKEDVKRYCQKVYPKLNISNIVEANDKVLFKNWCKVGSSECDTEKKVVPFRCLVDEYEADALMVPKGCKFNHLHDEASCMTHDDWKGRAKVFCRRNGMKLNDYGVLLSCGTDLFTGIEFVCCPHKHHKHHKNHKHNKHHKKRPLLKKKKPEIDRVALETAVKELQKFLPEQTQGCDRSLYETKRQKLEEKHQSKIASVVDVWDEAESRYKKLKSTDLEKAQKKMRKTLQVFRETLAKLEEEAKEERNRLKTEHANCIQMNIDKQKRDAMLAYLFAVEEKPHSIKNIIKTARKFFQVCEHDRLHSLRHFQHAGKQHPDAKEKLRLSLFNHLKELNDIVNKSLSLLSHLPDVAEKIGLNTVFEPSPTVMPELIVTEPPKLEPEEGSSKHIPERILKMIKKMKADEKKYEELEKLRKSEKVEPVTVPLLPVEETWPLEMVTDKPIEETEDTEGPRDWLQYKEVGYPTTAETPEQMETTLPPVISKKEGEDLEGMGVEVENEKTEETEEQNSSKKMLEVAVPLKKKLSKGTLNPTDEPPTTTQDNEGLPEDEGANSPFPGEPKPQPAKLTKPHHKKTYFNHVRSPAAFAAVIGLSCGALVIMLGIIVALVMRRNRANQGRVYIPDNESEDQEHLIKMQKSGYENPTYKFFYY